MMQTSPRQARQYASGVVEQQQDSLSNATILLQNLSPDQIRMPPAATKNNQHAPKLISSVGGQQALLIASDEPESELLTEKDRQTMHQQTLSQDDELQHQTVETIGGHRLQQSSAASSQSNQHQPSPSQYAEDATITTTGGEHKPP